MNCHCPMSTRDQNDLPELTHLGWRQTLTLILLSEQLRVLTCPLPDGLQASCPFQLLTISLCPEAECLSPLSGSQSCYASEL